MRKRSVPPITALSIYFPNIAVANIIRWWNTSLIKQYSSLTETKVKRESLIHYQFKIVQNLKFEEDLNSLLLYVEHFSK